MLFIIKMASAIEKVLEIAATNAFDNDSVQTCLDAVKDLSDNIDLLIGGAPAHLDTIKELADALDNSGNLATNLLAKIEEIDVKASSGGGGLDERPQWDLTQTISYSNTPVHWTGSHPANTLNFGTNTYNYNNLGEGAVALNGNYLAIHKCYNGWGLWVLKRESSTSEFKLYYRTNAGSHSTHSTYHSKNSIKITNNGIVYLGIPGSDSSKGKILIFDVESNTMATELKPLSDLSGSSYFGRGMSIAGDYLFVTAEGNKPTELNNTGSIFIYEKDANGKFSGNPSKLIHGTHDTSIEPLTMQNIGKNGIIAAEGDYFVTTTKWFPSGGGTKEGAVLFKKDANDDWNRECYLEIHYGANSTSSFPGDILIKNSQIIATAEDGKGLNIFNLSGERTQYFDTESNLLRREIIMFASADYLIIGYSPSTNEYSPTIYKNTDLSWNKIDYLDDILPINLTQNSTSSRYAQYAAAYYNNEIVFGQTHVDKYGSYSSSGYGALYHHKISNASVGYVTTDLEAPNIITKSLRFIDNEIPLQNKDGTKLSASKLINIDEDISCNSLITSMPEFDPKLVFTQGDTVPGYSSLGNTKADSIKLYKKYALLGFTGAQYSNNTYSGTYGAVVIMKKYGYTWERYQTLTPFLGSLAFNTSDNENNQTNFHNKGFGWAVDMNNNYIVVGMTSGIKLYKNTDGVFLPLNSSHFNYENNTSLSIGQSGPDAMKPSGMGTGGYWRSTSNGYLNQNNSVSNTMVITEDNLIVVSDSYTGTHVPDPTLYVFYINKNVPTTGSATELETYKWDVIKIDTTDLDTETQGIGKIIHYGNSIVFCNARARSQNNDYSFLYRYSYTVDSNGKPTFTYEQKFTEDSGVGFGLTQNDDFVFLVNPYNSAGGSELHIYEKATDESLSLLHTFTYTTNTGYNENSRGVEMVATNKRLYMTTPYDKVIVYKYDDTYQESNKTVYWKECGDTFDEYAFDFDIGREYEDRTRQYDYFQTNGTDLLIGQYNQKPKIYNLGKTFLKDKNDNVIFEFGNTLKKNNAIHFNALTGDTLTAESLDTETIETRKFTLNNTTFKSIGGQITINGDISCNNLIADTKSNIVNTNTLKTNKIEKPDIEINYVTKKTNIVKSSSDDDLYFGNFGISTTKSSDDITWLFANRGGQNITNRTNEIAIFIRKANREWSNENSDTFYSNASANSGSASSLTDDTEKKQGDFGFSFVVKGDYLAISAPSFVGQTDKKTGKIYIYKYDLTQASTNYRWNTELQQITPPNSGHYSNNSNLNLCFGGMMEMDDTQLIVSFPKASHSNPPDNSNRYGMIFIYEKSGDNFEHKQTLKESEFGDIQYGYNMSLSGDYLAVGAPYDDPMNTSNSGAIFIYKRVSGVWKKIQKIHKHPFSSSYRNNRFLGVRVNLYGDYLFAADVTSYVHVYKKTNDVFENIKLITSAVDADFGNTSASTYHSSNLKFPWQSWNMLYNETMDLLVIPSPRKSTAAAAKSLGTSNVGQVTIFKNFTKTEDIIGVGQNSEYFGQSTAIITDNTGTEIFISSAKNEDGTTNKGVVYNYSLNDETMDIIFNNDINGNKISCDSAVFNSLILDGKKVIPGEHIIKDSSGNLTIQQINTNKLELSGGNIELNSNIDKVQEILHGLTNNVDSDFGAKIRINGDYMFVTEYITANKIILDSLETLPERTGYIIRVLKKNANGIFERYNDASSIIEAIYQGTSSREFADFGDVQSVGNYLAVGSPQWNTGDTSQLIGRVFLFKNINGVWKNDYITAGTSEYVEIPDTNYYSTNTTDDFYGREFGAQIAMSKNYLAVSREVDPSGGKVFIYKRNDNNKYEFVMDISDNVYQDSRDDIINVTDRQFGSYLSMNENYLLVSDYRKGKHDNLNHLSGYVNVYKREGDNFVLEKRLFPPNTATSDYRFGWNHLVTDNYIFVAHGRLREDSTQNIYSSVIHIYKKNSSDSWEYLKYVVLDNNTQDSDVFAIYNTVLNANINSDYYRVHTKMVYKNNKLYIGMPAKRSIDKQTTYVGGVAVFRNDNDAWNEHKILYSPNQVQYEHYGRDIDVDDDDNMYISSQNFEESWENATREKCGIIYKHSLKLPQLNVENNEQFVINSDLKSNNVNLKQITLSGKTIKDIYARETSSNIEQVYYENFNDEDLTLHADSEANYKEGYFVDSKALNTIGRTPEGLQWVQDLPEGSKSLSFWLKISHQAGDKIILDTRDSNGKGFVTIFYKDNKMYISANGDTSKYPAKIMVDNTAVTIGTEVYKMKQLGTDAYLRDNKWHHWFIELAEEDNSKKITWFSRNTSGLLITNPEEWTEKQIYNPSDENTFSGLGGIMDIYGDYMVLGLPNRDTFDDNNTATTTDSGMVRILKKENNVWGKIKDISSNPSDLEYRKFGFSVSIHGDYLVVGDHSDDNADTNAGAIYIYKKDEGGTDNWGQIKKIEYPVEYDGKFGFSVKIYGDYIAVSAVRESPSYNGAIYVYKKDYDPDDVNTPSTDNWGQLKKLTPFGTDFDNGTINNSIQLGVGLEMDDNYIIGGSRRERAYIWKKDEGGVDNWGEIKVLQGSETVDIYDSYSTSSSNQANTAGESIAIDGDYIIISARGDQGRSNNTGKVYVYKNNNDSWDEIKILTYETPYSGDQFGRGLSIKDGIIAIGAPREDTPSSNCGAVTLFYKDEGGIDNWGQIKKLTASDAQSYDEFGINVIMQSGTIVVGAPLAESPSDSGAIYFFENSSMTTTSLFNIEAKISEYRIFNTSLATEQITDLYNGNDGNFKNKTISIDNNVSTKKLFTNKITLDGADLTKIVQTDSTTNHSAQSYYENFDAEDVTIHADSEMTYVTGRDGTGKALNTTGVTPDGLQWVQTLPANSKSFSFWLKIPEQTVPTYNVYDGYIFDGRDSGNNGYLTAYYKNNKMYILPTDNNKNKFPAKILIDGVEATVGDWTDDLGKQVGTGKYLQDNTWHHWFIELSDIDSVSTLTWFSRFEAGNNQNNGAWNEIKKLTASDAAVNDQFGSSIYMDGDYVVVGSWGDDDNSESGSGSVYIYEKDEGGTNNWGQLLKLTASDAGESDVFGNSVSINGNHIVVGAYSGDSDTIDNTGAAYVFKKDYDPLTPNDISSNAWGEIKKLSISDAAASDYIGNSVDVNGNYIVVSSHHSDPSGNSSGSVYIFKKDQGGTDNWGQIKKLVASDAVATDYFGHGLAIGGDYIVVGAYGDDDNGGASGSAYIFKKDQGGTDNWGELKKITASDAAGNDNFGMHVAIDGDYIVIGAKLDDDNGGSSGSAYVFKKGQGGTDNWGQIKKLTASDGAASDNFGTKVSINGDYITIGAWADDDNGGASGSGYIFYKDSGGTDNWGQTKKITPSDGAANDNFTYYGLQVYNNYIVASSLNNDDGGSNTGSAYIFRNDTIGSTSFFNIEAGVDDYRVFNKRLTNAEISDLAAGGNANVLGNAIVMDRIDVNDISCAALTVNGVSITQNGGAGGGGTTLSVDTISESTDATGVTIDSVLLKDNNVTAHTVTAQNYAVGSVNFISASRQGNFRDLEVKNSSNTETILLTGDGGNISINGTLSADTIGEKTSAAGVTIDSVLLKDNNVTAHTVTAQNYAVGSVNFISASRQGNFRDLEVKDSNNNATILLTGDGGEMSLEGTLTVDTINEKTTDSGVTIEGVLMRDGGATFTGDISANDASLNVVNIAALKVNGVSITQNGSGGASLNVNSDISINAIDAVDASFNTLRTSGTMVMGGHILPTSNATYDLGSAEYKIRHLFLSDNSLWLGDQHKIDVDSGKIRFKKRKTGTGFVPKEILDASANSTATQHLDGVIAEFGDVTTVDDIKLYHWEAWVADTAKSGVTGLLPHQLFLNDDNFDENDEVGTAIKLPVKEDAGAPSTTPAVGTMTYNSSDGKLYIYNGSAWKSFSPDV